MPPGLSPTLTLAPRASQETAVKQTQVHRLTQYQREGLAVLQRPALELREQLRQQLLANPVLREVGGEVVTLDEMPQDEWRRQRREMEADGDGKEHAEDELREVVENQAAFDYERRLGSGVAAEDPDAQERRDYRLNSLTASGSLREALLQAIHAEVDGPTEVLAACEALAGQVDENGYLTGDDVDLLKVAGGDADMLHSAIAALQALDPPGICARNLRECLLLQLRRRGQGDSLAAKIVEHHLEDVAAGRLGDIADALDCEVFQVESAVADIREELDPHPGWQLQPPPSAPTVAADLVFSLRGNGLEVASNRQLVPEIELDPQYIEMASRPGLDAEAASWLRQRLEEGERLVHYVATRHDTLERLGLFLLERQPRVFASRSLAELQPMTQGECAAALDVATSTVCRLVNGKYLAAPGLGTVPIKSFFTGGFQTQDGGMVSNRKVVERLKAIFAQGAVGARPLSDDAVSRMLRREGIVISRRTVTKYRLREGIRSSFQRQGRGGRHDA